MKIEPVCATITAVHSITDRSGANTPFAPDAVWRRHGMTTYRNFIFPLLARLDPEEAHERTLRLLENAQVNPIGQSFIRSIAGQLPQQPVQICGLTFPNVLGMAAGFDKDARVTAGLAQLGFGHVEVGTLTPRPQPGNPRPRIFRLPEDEALINRMGFPNGGVETAVARLSKVPVDRTFVLGVSLGKQKETGLADAAGDYIAVMRAVFPYADYLAVNISSPNTPGLRALQGGNYLGRLLDTLLKENQALADKHGVARRPLLVKIAPDLTDAELAEMVNTAVASGIDGIIATNTTLGRAGLKSPRQGEQGGLSGAPLADRSTQIIRAIAQQTGGKLPIIGVGGIRTAADVREKLAAGAALVQLYTALIYAGPGLPGQILRDLAAADRAA